MGMGDAATMLKGLRAKKNNLHNEIYYIYVVINCKSKFQNKSMESQIYTVNIWSVKWSYAQFPSIISKEEKIFF